MNPETRVGSVSGNFVESLAWVTNDEIRYGRPKVYRAPSWSWAAINRSVDFICRDYPGRITPAAELIDFDITLVDHSNPTGPVQAASVILKGNLTEIHWHEHSWQAAVGLASQGDESGQYEVLGHKYRHFSPDDLADTPLKAHCLALLETPGDDSHKHLEGMVLHQVREDAQSPASPEIFSQT